MVFRFTLSVRFKIVQSFCFIQLSICALSVLIYFYFFMHFLVVLCSICYANCSLVTSEINESKLKIWVMCFGISQP